MTQKGVQMTQKEVQTAQEGYNGWENGAVLNDAEIPFLPLKDGDNPRPSAATEY